MFSKNLTWCTIIRMPEFRVDKFSAERTKCQPISIKIWTSRNSPALFLLVNLKEVLEAFLGLDPSLVFTFYHLEKKASRRLPTLFWQTNLICLMPSTVSDYSARMIKAHIIFGVLFINIFQCVVFLNSNIQGLCLSTASLVLISGSKTIRKYH